MSFRQAFTNTSPSWASDNCWVAALNWRSYSLTSTWSAAFLFFQLSAKPYVVTAPQPRGQIDISLWKLTILTRTNVWWENHSICTWRLTREYLWEGPILLLKEDLLSSHKRKDGESTKWQCYLYERNSSHPSPLSSTWVYSKFPGWGNLRQYLPEVMAQQFKAVTALYRATVWLPAPTRGVWQPPLAPALGEDILFCPLYALAHMYTYSHSDTHTYTERQKSVNSSTGRLWFLSYFNEKLFFSSSCYLKGVKNAEFINLTKP